MHIALVSPAWPASEFSNGIVTYVDGLCRALTIQGHRISIFTPEIRGGRSDPNVHLVQPTFRDKLTSRLMKMSGREVYMRSAYADLIVARLQSHHRIDPIDAVEMEETFGWCGEVSQMLDIPVIAKLHGPAFLDLVEEDRSSELAISRLAAEKDGLRSIRWLTAPASQTLDATLSYYDLSPLSSEVIPNPMPINETAGVWKFANCDPNTILFVGRFDKRKGGDRALLVFKQLLAKNPKLRLVFIGPDYGLSERSGEKIHFADFVKLHFDDSAASRIQFLGQISREEVFVWRKKAMLTLILSRWDNQPNTALEAMMQGCPVVAFDAGGMSEIVAHGQTGLLVPNGEMDSLGNCITELLSNPPLAIALGSAARSFIEQRHSPKNVALQTAEFYAKAILMKSGGV